MEIGLAGLGSGTRRGPLCNQRTSGVSCYQTGYCTSTRTVASQDGAGAKTIAGGCSLLATVLSSFLRYSINQKRHINTKKQSAQDRVQLLKGEKKLAEKRKEEKKKKKKSALINGQTYILQLSKHNTATPPTFILLRLIHREDPHHHYHEIKYRYPTS